MIAMGYKKADRRFKAMPKKGNNAGGTFKAMPEVGDKADSLLRRCPKWVTRLIHI